MSPLKRSPPRPRRRSARPPWLALPRPRRRRRPPSKIATRLLPAPAKPWHAQLRSVRPLPPLPPATPPPDLASAMLLHEAMALLQLHAQAVAVNNIRTHVTTVLNVDSGNFNRWRDQFLLILGKFSLQDHIRAEPPAPISLDWARMDCVVKSWIVATLTDDLAEIISSQGSTARHAWLAVESQFLGNREARSIHLETWFRTFVQGDLSVTDYCRRLKKMADDLTALGEAIIDRTLVLNVIRGLNECFSHVGALLRRSRPFPTFLEARDDLILKELTLENKESPATALAASTAAGSSSAVSPASNTGSGGAGGPKSSNGNRRGKRGSGGKGGSGGNNNSGGQRPPSGAQHQQLPASAQQPAAGGRSWPSIYNPWMGSIQMWPGGPRPPLAPIPVPPHLQTQQQAFLAQQQQALVAHQQPAAPDGPGQWVAPGFYSPYGRPPFLGPDGPRLRLQHSVADPSFVQRVVLRHRFFRLGPRSSGAIAPGRYILCAYLQHTPLSLRLPPHCGIGVSATPVMRCCRSLRLAFPVPFRIVQIYVMLVS